MRRSSPAPAIEPCDARRGPSRRASPVARIFLVLAILPGTGCWCLRESIEPVGRRFEISRAHEFAVGRTTLADIERAFGGPETGGEDGGDDLRWKYWLYADQLDSIFDVILPEQLFAASFDADGVLVEVLCCYP